MQGKFSVLSPAWVAGMGTGDLLQLERKGSSSQGCSIALYPFCGC